MASPRSKTWVLFLGTGYAPDLATNDAVYNPQIQDQRAKDKHCSANMQSRLKNLLVRRRTGHCQGSTRIRSDFDKLNITDPATGAAFADMIGSTSRLRATWPTPRPSTRQSERDLCLPGLLI